MNIRDNLYSPLQNASLWIGAWLYGHISIDDADYSLTELFGQGHLVGIGDGNHEIFRILRKNTDLHHRSALSEEPQFRLLLGVLAIPFISQKTCVQCLEAKLDLLHKLR